MSNVHDPVAKRLQAPGWRDPRLIVGVVLVLLSIAGGVQLVRGLDHTDPVYAADRPLVPGEEITSADLRVVDVRLGGASSEYVGAEDELSAGTYTLRAVAPGELLPRSAIGDRTEAVDRTVTVTVDSATARTLSVGSVVDLWVSRPDPDGSGLSGHLDPEVLVEEATVAEVPGGGGALGTSAARSSVQIVVPAEDVATVIAAVDQDGLLTLVRRPEGGQPEDAP